MKKLIIAGMILSSLSSTLLVPLTYLDFELRKEFISEVLCINKDKPVSVCGGSCYLNERLKDVAEQQEDKTEAPRQGFKLALFKERAAIIQLAPDFHLLDTKTFYTSRNGKENRIINAIFRPPQFT